MKRQTIWICGIVLLSCGVMGYVDAVLQPGYAIKSAVKLPLFLLLPLLYAHLDGSCNWTRLFRPRKDGLRLALGCGFGVYILILAGYFSLRGIFDFSAVTGSLNQSVGVNPSNFIWVAIYISLVNSLLEEFFFRGFAFLTLKRTASRRFAYGFSSTAFALYHVAMMLGWFGPAVVALVLTGLLIGGLLFDFCAERYENIYLSWFIHLFANLSINTIGLILFGIL